jgi:hypothetical protein
MECGGYQSIGIREKNEKVSESIIVHMNGKEIQEALYTCL